MSTELTEGNPRKTVVIKAGETMVLPKGAKVVSVGKKGNVTATSNCPVVQTALDKAETYKCYVFGVGCDDDSNDSHVMDENNALIKKAIVGGNTYEFTNDDGILIDNMSDEDYAIGEFSSIVPKELMEVYEVAFEQWDKREEYRIRVRMLPTVAKTAELYLVGTGFPYGLYVKPVDITCPAEG